MFEALQSKEAQIAVIGLGYVGLPLALEFARKYRVVGFDINADRVEQMRRNEDPSREIPASAFEGCDIYFTHHVNDLKDCSFFVVAVPTPINQHNTPDLRPLFGASSTVGSVLSQGDIVVYESTVYPGCTEEDCIPILEKESGLTAGVDFHYGYSPERINPGDTEHTVCTIIKVLSGDTPESASVIEDVYGSIITAGVYRASSVKVAEAAKVIENTQRDLNIAFMNELSMIFDRMDIDTKGVLEAASTKWNFLRFYPGLVGGHCIGVDPYYLTYKAQKIGYLPEVILSGRRINDNVPAYLAKRLIQLLVKSDLGLKDARVLMRGITFKENVSDIRNSKVADFVRELESFGLKVEVIDPYADPEEVHEEYGFQMASQPSGTYVAVIVAVAHDPYLQMSPEDHCRDLATGGVFMDIKSIYDGAPDGFQYWRM